MSDSWYEVNGPTTHEVRSKLLSICTVSNIGIRVCGIKNISDISKIIDDTIKEEKGSGWGSYRGYYTFTHGDLVKKCNAKIDQYVRELERERERELERERERAIIVLKKYLNPWIQDRLYRPPTKTQSAGLRYKTIENNFSQLCNIVGK